MRLSTIHKTLTGLLVMLVFMSWIVGGCESAKAEREAAYNAMMRGPCHDSVYEAYGERTCPRSDQRVEVITRGSAFGKDGYIICRCPSRQAVDGGR